jgi:hypothetical protein
MPPYRYIPFPMANSGTSSSSGPSLTGGLMLFGGLLLTYHLGKKLIEELQKGGAERRADDSPEVQQAMLLRMAMNPSGVSWMMSFDATLVDKIMEVGRVITNLDAVGKAYRDLYRDSLLTDLQSELSADEYQRFITLVTSNPGKEKSNGKSSPPNQFAKPQVLIVAKKDMFVRSSPDASYHGAFYEQFSDKNILRTAKSGEFLGYATGMQSYDQKNDVKFIRVGFSVMAESAPLDWKKRAREKVTFWVSSSANYVDQFNSEAEMLRAYPGIEAYSRWMKPLDYYDKQVKGLWGITTGKGLVSTGFITVFDEELRPVGRATPDMLLGVLEMELKNGQETYYRFRTENNRPRWVNSQQVKILQP